MKLCEYSLCNMFHVQLPKLCNLNIQRAGTYTDSGTCQSRAAGEVAVLIKTGDVRRNVTMKCVPATIFSVQKQ